MAKVRLPSPKPPPLTLLVLRCAKEDLEGFDGQARKVFWALVDELRDDQRKLERLTGDGDAHCEDFFDVAFVGGYGRQRPAGEPHREIWRLKSYDLHRAGVPVRFIYGYFPGKRTIVVLAAAPRDWNYVYDDILGRRIARDYDRMLGQFG